MSAPDPVRRRPFPLPLHPPDDERDGPPALPRPLTSFVGRTRETDLICALLRDPDVRLVTLTGPGGSGKTRLAIRAAEAVLDDVTLAGFVALAPLADPSLVIPTIAQQLGVRDAGERRLIDRLALHVAASGPALLVLDNFEQVADAAVDIAQLLAASPGLTILVTSRVVLRVSGEYDVPVPPLAFPGQTSGKPLEMLSADDAVSLFVQRAQAVNPAFALSEANAAAVAEICARLDGLPLAIELAAAHTRVLSPSALSSRLAQRLELLVGGPRDQPARLQTMRGAIGWSFDLLSAELQAWFCGVSVFVGGFTIESADAVVGRGLGRRPPAPGHPSSTFLAIEGLIDASLIVRDQQPDGEPRFRMLETIREFGLERLAESDQGSPVRDAHAACYLKLLAEAESKLIADGASSWVERIAIDWPNIRAAISWTLASGNGEAILALAGTLLSVAYARGSPAESLAWLESALSLPGSVRPEIEVDACFAASALAQVLGDFERAIALSERAIEVARAHRYTFGEARALLGLGITAEWQGDFGAAFVHYAAADRIMREIREPHRLPHWTVLPAANLADLALLRGDTAQATRLGEEAVQRWREAGYVWGIAQALGTVAAAAVERGELTLAARRYEETLDEWIRCDDGRGIAGTMAGIAGLSAALNQLERAARLLGAAWRLGDRLGLRFLAHHIYAERVRAAVRLRLGEHTFAVAWDDGSMLDLDAAIAEARAILTAATQAARPDHGLTPREIDVLRFLVAGHSDRQIAAALSISPRTVQTHVAGIFSKLRSNSRAEAAAIAVRRHLV